MKPRRSIRVLARAPHATFALVGAAFLLLLSLASPAFAGPLVVIDAGHGGPFNHARYGSLAEKQANLLFSLELGSQLLASGYDVAWTRTADVAVGNADIPTWHWLNNRWVYAPDGVYWYSDGTPRDDLQARVDVANNMRADVFISMHCNGSESSAAHGTENWSSSHDVRGQQLGQFIQGAVLERTGQHDRGAGITDFYVVRWSNAPAVLVETGFMSNPTEGSWIANASWRRAYCAGIVTGINRWMAADPYRPSHPRYAASTPAKTAIVVAKTQWPGSASTVLLASGTDTLSAVAAPLATKAWGAPLLIAGDGRLAPTTAEELARLRPARIIAFGADLSDDVLAQAATAAGIDASAVVRIAGSGPAAVAPLLSEQVASTETSMTLIVGSGTVLSDGLAASMLAAAHGNGALVLTGSDGRLPAEASAFVDAHRGNISATIGVGAVPQDVLAGLPNVSRIGSSDPYQTFAAAVQGARPSGSVWVYGYNPLLPIDSLVAVTAATQRLGGVPLPVTGKYLSPYVREYLENAGERVFAVTMVGTYTDEPPLADYMILKSIQ